MSWLSNLGGDISNFFQKDIIKPVENVGTDIANVWNKQPTWAKGLEIALPAALVGGEFLAPELLGGAGAAGGFDLSALLGGGAAAAEDASIPASAILDSGASSLYADLGGTAGLDAAALDPAIGSGALAGGGAGAPLDLLAGGGGATAGSGGGGASSWLSSLIGGAGKGNLLTTLGLGAAGMALSPEISKLIGTPGAGNLQQQAQQLQQQGINLNTSANTLMDPLTSGVLPPGQQAALDAATRDAITTTKSKYAGMGLSGSTMEADAVSNVQVQANAQKVQIEQQMYQSGLQAAQQATQALGLEASLYNDILGYQMQNDQALMKAIAGFAGAIGGAQVKAGA